MDWAECLGFEYLIYEKIYGTAGVVYARGPASRSGIIVLDLYSTETFC